MKICPDCKVDKSFEDFHRDISKKDHCGTYCKVCSIVRANKNYAANKDARIAQMKEYRARNSDEVRRRHARYAAVNKEKIKEYHLRWRAENKDKHYKDVTARMKYLVQACKSRTQKSKKYSFDLSWQGAFALLEIQGSKCALTGITFDFSRPADRRVHPYAPSIDRKDSSKGYTYDNVQFLCWIVNQAKSDYPQDLFDAMCRARVEMLNRG